MIAYRDATAADLVRFYGEPLPVTVRAVVVTMNDEPAAVIGLTHAGSFFSDMKPELAPHLKSMPVLRAIKRAMVHVENSRKKVYALQQPGTNILSRLGFGHVRDDVYQYGVK